MRPKITIYTDGACSGNPGHIRPKQRSCMGVEGSRGFAASSRMTRPGLLKLMVVV